MADSTEQPDNGSSAQRRFNADHYERLRNCVLTESIYSWNVWREDNRDEEVLLEGADLAGLNLTEVDLRGAKLCHANLRGTNLSGGQLEGADFSYANLAQTILKDAAGAGARFVGGNLEQVDFWRSDLRGAELWLANLKGARLFGTDLRGAKCWAATVDGETMIWDCVLDEETDFRAVGLRCCRLQTAARAQLEYNMRRQHWRDWYASQNRFVSTSVQMFWWLTDYGTSTLRVLGAFVFSILLFANVHLSLGTACVSEGSSGWPAPLRALLFSVYSMLPFSGIDTTHAGIVSLFVIVAAGLVGTILWSALVARLVVLFNHSGPGRV